jgi:hypothetical protein
VANHILQSVSLQLCTFCANEFRAFYKERPNKSTVMSFRWNASHLVMKRGSKLPNEYTLKTRVCNGSDYKGNVLRDVAFYLVHSY